MVTDPTGAVIAHAEVRAYDSSGGLAGRAFTDEAGRYNFATLPEGSVRLDVQSPGFQMARINNVTQSNQDVRLQVGSAQTVEVNAVAANMNRENASVSMGASGRNLGSGRALGNGVGNAMAKPAIAAPSGVAGGMIGSDQIASARASLQAAARAQELGDLFEYKLKDPITIRKNSSALLPIVQSSIDAEKVSVWNERAGLAKPQRALWLTNTSGLTLDGGSFSVLEQDTFAGEGIFDPIRPAEKRLVSYATDLALNVRSANNSERDQVTRVHIEKGSMTQVRELRERKTYTFRNEDTSARSVIVEHPFRLGYQLRGDAKPAETTAEWMRFRLPVASKQTAELVVEEARTLQSSFALNNVTSEQIALFVQQKSIDKSIEDALKKIVAQKSVVSSLEAQKSDRDDETTKIFDDQQRLRENMKALKGSAEEKVLLQRYTRQLNDQEDRLEALKKEIKDLDAKVDAAQEELDKMIAGLSFDVKM
jgi:hypothetical protein